MIHCYRPRAGSEPRSTDSNVSDLDPTFVNKLPLNPKADDPPLKFEFCKPVTYEVRHMTFQNLSLNNYVYNKSKPDSG